jgi:hypothetical protein
VERGDDGTLRARARRRAVRRPRRAAARRRRRRPLDEISLRRPTLDDVFLQLTGRPPAADATDEEPAA